MFHRRCSYTNVSYRLGDERYQGSSYSRQSHYISYKSHSLLSVLARDFSTPSLDIIQVLAALALQKLVIPLTDAFELGSDGLDATGLEVGELRAHKRISHGFGCRRFATALRRNYQKICHTGPVLWFVCNGVFTVGDGTHDPLLDLISC